MAMEKFAVVSFLLIAVVAPASPAPASKHNLKTMLEIPSMNVKTLLINSRNSFKEKFKEMLSFAENNTIAQLEASFERTERGFVPRHTKHFFSSLYSYLNEPSKHDLQTIVSNFFAHLFPEVFHRLINNRANHDTHEFDNCLRQAQPDISPFGDIPAELTRDLEQSFDSSKALLTSVQLAIEVINVTATADTSEACNRELIRFASAPSPAKPCLPYCQNVYRGCLAHLAELDRPWREFVSSLERLSTGLVGSHNAENVLANVESRFDKAIKHALNSSELIVKRVKVACGRPKRYSKRSTDEERGSHRTARSSSSPAATEHHERTNPDQSASPRLHGAGPISGTHDSHSQASGVGLQRPGRDLFSPGSLGLYVRIQNFVHQLAETKGFFVDLADSLCRDDIDSKYVVTGCWNGWTIGEYTKTVAGVGVASQSLNPEIGAVGPVPSSITALGHRLSDNTRVINALNAILSSRGSSHEFYYGDAASGDGSGEPHHGIGLGAYGDDEDYENENGEGSGAEGSGHSPDDEDPKINTINTDLSFDPPKKPNADGTQTSSARSVTAGAWLSNCYLAGWLVALVCAAQMVAAQTQGRVFGGAPRPLNNTSCARGRCEPLNASRRRSCSSQRGTTSHSPSSTLESSGMHSRR